MCVDVFINTLKYSEATCVLVQVKIWTLYISLIPFKASISKFSWKCQIVNIFGCAGHAISVETTQYKRNGHAVFQ